MAQLKVFVSSTCYDLGPVREQLRTFLQDMGYDPIMSEYSDVLYHPQEHTHTACIQEVPNCDMVVVIIGKRFGGEGLPQAMSRFKGDIKTWVDKQEKVSITQLEVLRAVEDSIPVFAFVDDAVWHDHYVYQENKGNAEIVDAIKFPSIEKHGTAKYIFSFLDFIRKRSSNNSLQPFKQIRDIETHLKKQWSALFQRLLTEQRQQGLERRQAESISSQIDDLKTAILSTISEPDKKEIAKDVIRYRKVIHFAKGLGFGDAIEEGCSWNELLTRAEAVAMLRPKSRRHTDQQFLLRRNGEFVVIRGAFYSPTELKREWTHFVELDESHRKTIAEAWEGSAEEAHFHPVSEHFRVLIGPSDRWEVEPLPTATESDLMSIVETLEKAGREAREFEELRDEASDRLINLMRERAHINHRLANEELSDEERDILLDNLQQTESMIEDVEEYVLLASRD